MIANGPPVKIPIAYKIFLPKQKEKEKETNKQTPKNKNQNTLKSE